MIYLNIDNIFRIVTCLLYFWNMLAIFLQVDSWKNDGGTMLLGRICSAFVAVFSLKGSSC